MDWLIVAGRELPKHNLADKTIRLLRICEKSFRSELNSTFASTGCGFIERTTARIRKDDWDGTVRAAHLQRSGRPRRSPSLPAPFVIVL